MATTVTSTIRSSGGTYTSLSAWFAVKQGNIVTADQVQVAECYDDWATGLDDAVTITGATTDSTRYYKITVASGNRHTGIPQTGFFIKRAHTGSGIIRLDQNYTEVEWLDVEQTSTGDDYKAFITVAGKTGIKITNCLAKSVASASGASFYIPDATAICCLAYESTRTGFGLNAGSSTYNCTSAECRFGFSADSTAPIIKNCVSYNSSYSNYFNVTGTNCDYNATSTGSDDAPGANSVISVASGDFVNAASNDFHLASGSALIGAGTNLYSTFTTDIDGDTWPSSGAWDIGFDYRVAGGGGATGTGAPAAQSATVAGTATRTVTGSGTPTAQAATAAGTAEREITSSGTPAAQSATVSGTGTVGAVVTGSGSPQAQSATVAGTAERTVTASGTVAAQSATVAGTAEREITSSGTPTAQSATVVGTGQVGNIITGSGAPTAQSATVAGTAEREVTSSGSPSAQSATVAGTAVRTITGSGSPQAQSATVYGYDSAPDVPSNTGGGGIGRVYSSKKLRKEVDEWLEKQQESERQKFLARLQREDEELMVIMLALAA